MFCFVLILALLVVTSSLLSSELFLWSIIAAVILVVEEFNICPHGLYCCCGIYSWICFVLYCGCPGYALFSRDGLVTPDFYCSPCDSQDCPFGIFFLHRLGVCAPVLFYKYCQSDASLLYPTCSLFSILL